MIKKAFLVVILLLIIFSQSHEPISQQVYLEKSAYVFLLHGLARSSSSMDELENSLSSHGYKVINVDYPSTEHPIEYLADEILSSIIEPYSKPVQSKIHFVTHSMGSIVVRYYLKHHDLPSLGRVVMVSPPNQGSELVDRLKENFIFKKRYGPAGQQLGTDEASIPVNLGPVDFELGVITGNRSFNPISSIIIPGPDDGMVSVARARISGMADFIEVPENHSFIIHSQTVIDQIIHFLEHGVFRHEIPDRGAPSIHKGKAKIMTEGITLPLWLVVIGGVLAVWALLDRLLLPGLRWFLRHRDKVVIKEIDEYLNLHLPPFKLMKRKVLIVKLMSDPKVLDAVEEYCQKHGISTEAGLKRAEYYAKEIAPSFHAYIYFRIGYRLSKFVARLLYRVRICYADEENLAKIDPYASVVFLMNHRSNMDYILLGYLAMSRAVLSFAVGEWARIWGLQQLLRAMGAYFVRRGSGNPLYRCVLARYVQLATAGGVVQAVYLEGGLSRDGKLREPKIGLLDYMLRNFDPDGGRDIVFVPAGVNYDRVLEDRTVLLDTGLDSGKESRKNAIITTIAFFFRNIWLMIRGRWYRFGYAAVNFGRHVSLREYMKTKKVDFRVLNKEARIEKVKNLASGLLREVGKVIPVLPVSLIAYVFTENPDKAFSDLELKARVRSLIKELEAQGAHVYIPRSDRDYAIDVGLRMLTLRHLVVEEDNLCRAASDGIKVLQYYANSIIHFFPLSEISNKSISSDKS